MNSTFRQTRRAAFPNVVLPRREDYTGLMEGRPQPGFAARDVDLPLRVVETVDC